jgi:PDZ domain
MIAAAMFATGGFASFESAALAQPGASAEPTVTPLPPEIVRPPDAAGIAATTPPLGDVTPRPAPSVPDMIWPRNVDSVTVNFASYGGHPFVPVVVDGVRRQFLLSTIEPSAIDASIAGAGNSAFAVVQTFQIGDVRMTGVQLQRERLIPYGQMYLGQEADGILGAQLFQKYPVTIDYGAHTLTIARSLTPTPAGPTQPAPSPSPLPSGAVVVPLVANGAIPRVACSIDGSPQLSCAVDVDSGSQVVSPADVVAVKKLMVKSAMLTDMRAAQPGLEMPGDIVRAHALSVGALTIANPLIEIPKHPADFEPPRSLPRIGGGVLDRFIVLIDEPDRQVVFVPEAGSALTSFDRSGLWLIWRNGALVVRNVDRGSPADRARIARRDTIVSIDDVAASDLESARIALAGPPGTIVKISFEHRSHRRDTRIVLRTLI